MKIVLLLTCIVCLCAAETPLYNNNGLASDETPELDVPCGTVQSTGGPEFGTTRQGNSSKYTEFPWMAGLFIPKTRGQRCALTNDNCWSFQCGGSLVSLKVVLTAASCVFYVKQANIKARAGDWDLNTFEEHLPYQERLVAHTIIHQRHHRGTRTTYPRYDMALLVVESPYSVAENVGIICLPPPNLDTASTSCRMAGWSMQQFGVPGYQGTLKVLDMYFMGHDQCQNTLRRSWRPTLELDKSFTCAVGVWGKDTCEGNTGGPLMCVEENRYYVRSVVSWYVGCERTNRPRVFADVVERRKWIDLVMTANVTALHSINGISYYPVEGAVTNESNRSCSSGEWACLDGGCIGTSQLCSGLRDCADGSDETIQQCGQVQCSGSLFRCDYGACVHRGSICNGTVECADGSDETPELCSKGGTVVGTTQSPTTSSPSEQMCILPPYPRNGTYVATVGHRPGDVVSYTSLTYSCERGYVLNGEASPICLRGTWPVNVPTCEQSEEVIEDAPPCGEIMSSNSGQFRIEKRITGGGTDSKYIEFPWMVVVFSPHTIGQQCALNERYCWDFRRGGFLIGSKVVLSTAGSFYLYRHDKLKARAGHSNSDTFEETHPYQERFVKEIIIHPQNDNPLTGVEFRNDVALLVLESPFTNNVAFICLPQPDLNFTAASCKVSGWDAKIKEKNGSLALLGVDVNYVDHDQCQSTLRQNWRSDFALHDSFSCVIELGEMPWFSSHLLLCIAGNHYYARGLASWSAHYNNTSTDVYTDVVKSRNWIDQTMRANNFSTDTYTHKAYRN